VDVSVEGGHVALVTGAAGGQGRAHCVRLAQDGIAVIAVDRCADLDRIPYEQPNRDDLHETVALVEAAGGHGIGIVTDVRDLAGLGDAVRAGVQTFGPIDVVCANAGVIQLLPATEIDPVDWATVIDINLTGTWNTISATLPTMIDAGRGGSIVITTSVAALKGTPGMAHYAASKAAMVGLARTLAAELGPHRIRVNCVAPTMVNTKMLLWDGAYQAFRPDLDAPSLDDVIDIFASGHPLGVPWVEPIDVAEVVAWLVSNEARYVTGAVVPVDAGALIA